MSESGFLREFVNSFTEFSKSLFASEFPLYHPQVELEKIRVLLKGKDFERVTSQNILAMLPS